MSPLGSLMVSCRTVSLFPQAPMNSEVITDPVQVKGGCPCSHRSHSNPTHMVSTIVVS